MFSNYLFFNFKSTVKPLFLGGSFFICSLGLNADTSDWNVSDTGEPYTEVEFALTEGTWMSLDVSPDGESIVFDLLGDIYQIPAVGGDAALIHGGPAIQRMPNFSPDGSKILYLSDASGTDNVWISDVDGSAARQVTSETARILNAPTWNPEGDALAIAITPPTYDKMYTSHIRLFDLLGAGAGQGRLLIDIPASGRDAQEAEFSPDGRYLYYTERVVAPDFVYVNANHINFAIKRRELQTGAEEVVAAGFGGAFAPRISPDGEKLAFIRRVKDKTVLFVQDLQTGKQTPVYDQLDRDATADFVPQGNYYPQYAWFPDNRHVAIWGKGRLYRINMETGDSREIPFRAESRHRITDAPRFVYDLAPKEFTARVIRHIALSPNGDEMLFTAIGSLWKKNLPAGKPERLTDATTLESDPAYSNDGQFVAYVEWNDEQGSALKLMDISSAEVKTITTSRGMIRQPGFSPDGKQLVYWVQPNSTSKGGYGVKPGAYRVSSDGGEPRYVVEANGRAQFSPDGERIYYVEEIYGDELVHWLKSVDLDGLDGRVHAQTLNADTVELTVSPALDWIAFKEEQQYYVLPYRETGEPLVVSSTSDAVPVAPLTDIGGYSLTWSADSATLNWMLGPELYRVDVSQQFVAGATLPQFYAAMDLQVKTDVPEGSVAFTNGRIITMEGTEVIENGTVLVQGNRIVAVGAADKVSIPEAAKVIDVSGKTVMPGLVDMHGHIDCCYGTDSLPQKQASRYAAMAFGITTNFDPYASELPSYELNETNLAGLTVGPRSITVGTPIYGRAKKPDFAYFPIENYDQALAIMQRKRALGGTIIKSYKQPSRYQRQQLVAAGREAGVMLDGEGESHYYVGISLILDGHTNFEHSLPVANYYDDVIQLMAHSQTAKTPTLIVTFAELFGENYFYQNTRAWDDPKIQAYVQQTTSSYSPLGSPHSAPPHVRSMTSIHAADEIYDIGFRSVARSIKALDDAGVVINAGSHGNLFGLGLHWEIWLLAEGGMSNHRLLRTATINGAKTLGLDGQIGSLEEGKLADLIVLDANPLEDIRNTNSVRYVMVNGRLYDALTMDEIGNYDHPRTQFYWEMEDYNGIDWNSSWSGQ